MKTPINRETLKLHWMYSWWKYVLAVVLCVFGINLIYTVTEPRIPDSEKLDVLIYGNADTEAMDAWLEEVRAAQFPEQKKFTATALMPDETYGPMALMARLGANEGDVFVLPREQYQAYAGSGAFMALEDQLDVGALGEEMGVLLERAWRRDEDSGERHLYGLPIGAFPQLKAWCQVPENSYVSIRVRLDEDDRALRLLLLMLESGKNVAETT